MRAQEEEEAAGSQGLPLRLPAGQVRPPAQVAAAAAPRLRAAGVAAGAAREGGVAQAARPSRPASARSW